MDLYSSPLLTSAGLVLSLLLASPAQSQTRDAPPAREADAVERLAWLAGCWEGTLANEATYEEVWLRPRGGTLLGMARMTRGGRTMSWEFMRIAEDDDDLVYTAQPSGQELASFRARTADSTSVTFENPDHDFPQRILYRLTPPDDLLARIEGERGGELRGFDFPLRRVACPG